MDPVSILTIIDLSAKVLLACYRVQSQIKAAKGDIGQLIDELESVSVVLAELYRVVDRNSTRSLANLGNALLADVEGGPLAAVQRVLDDLQAKLQPMLKPGLKSKILWPFESKTIQSKIQVLQNSKATLQLAISSYQTAILGNQTEKLSNLENNRNNTERANILKWLKVCDPEANHRLSCKQHEPRTSEWLFENATFQSWADMSHPLLWLHGIPGAGKTILCSSIIEYLRGRVANDTRTLVLYFYFDFADNKKQSAASLLKSLIYQLIAASAGSNIEPAIDLYGQCNAGAEEPEVDELIETFSEILPARESIYVCIDALDECFRGDRGIVFQFLETCAAKNNLVVSITSRREVDIEDGLKKFLLGIIPIARSTVNADIRTWVENNIARDSTLSKWRPTIQHEMLEAIVQGSNGMFRWAVCQMETMRQCITPAMIRAELKELPQNLDQMYDRILQAVPRLHRQYVQSALHWLAFATRPLLLAELAEAVVIEPENTFDPDACRLVEDKKIL
ncbi:ankyrin repeat-containing protein [Pochonia chlamydosporia 170]|uniref:Ankyrin repeat-containing protein n=1 Tax=Pochonia chlamydosporia 170 TaxID=1380566 RepID=A0A179FVB3_METCM|nr:ankyrin repeat-containing protein [Pochonia chlamydosporia 170]OAQ69595.2 ankyrin repeat-containing protein [Pochonia chlamydosporia 170]